MQKLKKISSIKLLMIVSQLLLTLFLSYWVYSQFTKQKDLLSEDLNREFRMIEEQVIDSILSSKLIDPYLTDTNNVAVYMIDSEERDTIFRSVEIEGDGVSSPRMFMKLSANINDSQFHKQHQFPQKLNRIEITNLDHNACEDSSQIMIQAEYNSENDLLFQSVRLFINTIGVFGDESQDITSFLSINADSSMFKELYEKFLQSKYATFTTEWLNLSDEQINKSSSYSIQIKGDLFQDTLVANVRYYQVYLLRAMSTQVVFAFILLLIVAMAFRLAYSSLKKQEELILIKNDFISNISHELKTPVSTVKVALEALLDFDRQKDAALTKNYLEMAYSEMNRLDLLVNQVLNNSALEEGNKLVYPESINLNELIKDVVRSMQSRFNEQSALVNFVTNNDETIIDADKLHIHGVLVNLLDNSLKYTHQKPQISINLLQDPTETKLTISDNGIGISNEYLSKVFDKFFRVPTDNIHNVKGYGLGLNYAALVMNQHNGRISVENNIDEGCKFTLWFPNKIE